MTSQCYKKTCPHQQIHWNVKIRQCRERSLVSFLLFLLYPVSCLLSHVSCLLSPISFLLSPFFQFPVSRLLSPVSSLLSLCFPSSFSCLSSLVSHLAVSWLLSTVSRLQCCKCCRVSDFMEQISGLGQFSDLNASSGHSGLEANNFLQTWSLADLEFSIYQLSWAKFELAISVFHSQNFQLCPTMQIS